MKNFRKSSLLLLALVMMVSCDNGILVDDSEDLLTGGATTASMVKLSGDTGGKLLGVPSSLDFETATVSFAEFDLNMEVLLDNGGQGVSGYEIIKSLNGGAGVSVASSPTLPVALEYATLAEFLEGLGVSETDLRIGDVITFKTKMILDDGTEVFSSNEGTVNVTVNCSSSLAGEYEVALNYVRASSGIDEWYYYDETITETAAGEYRTAEVGPWIDALGGGLGVGTPGYTLTDTCGEITIPEQNLLEFYSNVVSGAGSVDGSTGVITVAYTICASDCRELYVTYTPKTN